MEKHIEIVQRVRSIDTVVDRLDSLINRIENMDSDDCKDKLSGGNPSLSEFLNSHADVIENKVDNMLNSISRIEILLFGEPEELKLIDRG